MKKSGLLKILLVVGLSMLLIANVFSLVSATDDYSSWENPAINITEENTTDTNSDVSTTNSGTSAVTTNTVETENTTNTNSSSISTGNATTTLNTSTDNTNEENGVNSLAYTGIGDTSILAVIIVLGAIVAGYSLKKVREYNV